MSGDARKKMAQAIVIGIEPHKGKDADDEPAATGPDEGLVACMEDFLAAVEAKDAKAMAESFESAAVCAKGHAD